MRLPLLLALALAACTPQDRSVQHALLDAGYDSVLVLGWAPSCAPDRGAYFEARGWNNTIVTGVVCCARSAYACTVEVTPISSRGG